MMNYYFVKQDLWGVKAGTVERFADSVAMLLIKDKKIEPYEEEKHGNKPGSPKQIGAIYERRRQEYEARIAALYERRRREEDEARGAGLVTK
jgi:hypothetical protein